MEDLFNQLVSRLKTAHGEDLISVVLHGSAVAAASRAHQSDYKLMVMTKTLSAEALRQTQPVAKWWVSAGFPLPVYFTESEFNDSLDVFPIEFQQMKRAYRVLYGRDVLAGAQVSNANLRLQIEYELRGKLLRLRALYLPASDSAEGLKKLMADSIVSFVQFMRPILDLFGEEPPLDRRAVIQRVGGRLGLDTSALDRVLRLRSESTRLLEMEVQDLFADYISCLTRLIAAVDKI